MSAKDYNTARVTAAGSVRSSPTRPPPAVGLVAVGRACVLVGAAISHAAHGTNYVKPSTARKKTQHNTRLCATHVRHERTHRHTQTHTPARVSSLVFPNTSPARALLRWLPAASPPATPPAPLRRCCLRRRPPPAPTPPQRCCPACTAGCVRACVRARAHPVSIARSLSELWNLMEPRFQLNSSHSQAADARAWGGGRLGSCGSRVARVSNHKIGTHADLFCGQCDGPRRRLHVPRRQGLPNGGRLCTSAAAAATAATAAATAATIAATAATGGRCL